MSGDSVPEIVIKPVTAPEERSLLCKRILQLLPAWFGIPEAVIAYTDEVKTMETWVALIDNLEVGFISVNKPNAATAEIHVMGILQEHHRKGIGTLLVKKAEAGLSRQGFRFLQVKTLSAARPCPEYDITRKFYMEMGFYPVEEFKTLWGSENPCLQLIKTLQPATGALHHIEIYVADLRRSLEFWSWLLCDKLGYKPFQEWNEGESFILGSTYIVFVQAEKKYLDVPYHRCRPGLNHLAFHAGSKEQVDELTRELEEKGCKILYRDRHPHAGGDSYAVFFEDPERMKVEVTYANVCSVKVQ